MAISYIHPSVSSTITDNSTTYITATGTTKLFAVFTSEKGIDNEIKMITSASEFVFNYGEPSMKLYGQASYNIINWLNAGGSVYCLRVLPDDAGFANAIVNIQTKVGTKEVLDVDGNVVIVDDVQIRPCVTYTSVNNKTKSSIEFNELRRSVNTTIDGFTNNMLFAVIPKGRGKGYNNLGFRFTLVDSFDSTYEFRLYNFEVVETSETGNVSTIQGPFLVSLDPDAMSLSGSSMFIVDVIDNFCDYFTVIFNEDNYEKLAHTINKDVHPNKIDFFNGLSRHVNGEYETYYNDITKKEEDVHMSIVKYVDHLPTDEKNIVDTNDVVENAIANVDSAYRSEQFSAALDSFERVKVVLSTIRRIEAGTVNAADFGSTIKVDTFGDNVNLNAAITTLTNDDTLDTLYTDFGTAKATLTNTVSEVNYNAANAKMTALSVKVSELLLQLHELFDYAKICESASTANATRILNDITSFAEIESQLKIVIANELFFNKIISSINALRTKYNEIDGNNTTDVEKIEFLLDLIEKAESIVKSIKTVSDSTETNTFADAKLTQVETLISAIKLSYELLTDGYITRSDYEEALNSAWSNVENLLDVSLLSFAVNLAMLEHKAATYEALNSDLSALKQEVESLISIVVTNIGTYEYEVAKSSVIAVEKTVNEIKHNTYNTLLQNYDSYINLMYGSDGSIGGVSYKDPAVEKLIIAGYKGMIDTSLTEKSQWPIDMVLDANYSVAVKNAIATLCTEIRDDFMGILDTELQSSPAGAVAYRKNSLGVNNFRLAIFTQDFIVSDTEFTGNNMQVTPTYFLASKIPANDNTNGIHWNFVGPRRGNISGYKSISFLPNPEWRERLYSAQVNYVQQDQVSTRFNSQLTSQSNVSALSNISCVRTILRIQRDVEDLMKNFQFEFNDDRTLTSAQTALNNYLSQWTSNRACDSITGSVYASSYDRQQKLIRVKVELTFNSIIERIAIDLAVNA